MSAVPYMNTYVADFLADTEDLTNEEFGAYVRLIFFNWKKRRALVDDTKRIARLLRCTPGRWLKKLKPVLIEFFETDESGAPIGGKLVQKRVEAERAKALNKALKDDETGAKNARIRRHIRVRTRTIRFLPSGGERRWRAPRLQAEG